MKNKCLLIILLLLSFGSSSLFSFESGDYPDEWDVEINADLIKYDREKETVFASGNVKITYMDIVMTAHEISYSRLDERIEARGDIDFERDFFSIKSSSMVYNIESSTGHVHYARVVSKEIIDADDVSSPPLIIEAESIELRGNDEFFIPRGLITTCDAENPHYYFSGSSIFVRLQDRFSLKNALFVIRGAPVFYYPYYSKNLGPEKFKWNLDAGSSRVKGIFVRLGASYPFTENSRTGLSLELMQKGGPGFILDHSYSTNSGNADFEAYYLSLEKKNQGRLRASGYQKINQRLGVRYKARYSSQRMIEHDYFDEEGYGEDILYFLGGLEYTTDDYSLSLYGDRDQLWEKDSYEISRMTLPGIKARFYPRSIGKDMSFSASADYKRKYDVADESFKGEVDWDSSLKKTFRINLNRDNALSFSPGTGYRGTYIEENANHFVSLFSQNRYSYSSIFTADADYMYRADYETFSEADLHRLNYRMILRPYRPLRLTAGGRYDFNEKEEPLSDITSELRYNPDNFSFYLKNRYDYYQKNSEQWLGEFKWRDFSETTVKYAINNPQSLDIDQQFKFKVGVFDIMPALRFKTEDYYSFEELTEQRLDILWDMHCWESRFRLRRRGEETELWVLFNISVFPQQRVGVYGNLAPDIMDFRYHKE
ncbi:MAG: hypothetical protein ACQESB_02570 [Elusimicrobiota bacterium]